MFLRISSLVVLVVLVAAACADDTTSAPVTTPGPPETAPVGVDFEPPFPQDQTSVPVTTPGPPETAPVGVDFEPPFPQDQTSVPVTTPEPPETTSATVPPLQPLPWPTEAEARSAALLFDWEVTFGKTATIVPSPLGELANGTQYMITLAVEDVCDNTSCIQKSHAHVDNPLWGWTITEPLLDSEWFFANGRWRIEMDGYYLSADYGNGNTCIYAWTEEWDIEVLTAVQNGNGWLATGFLGSMVRSESLDPVRSAQAIGNEYCPPYESVTVWSAVSERDKAPIPPGD